VFGSIESFAESTEAFPLGTRMTLGKRKIPGKAAVWEVYRFIHVNTVAPFGTFRTKIRKWKKAAL
jgi:hypothetical protein